MPPGIGYPRASAPASSVRLPSSGLRAATDEILSILQERRVEQVRQEALAREAAKEAAELELENRRVAALEQQRALEARRVSLDETEARQGREDRAEAMRILGLVPANGPAAGGLPAGMMGPDESGATTPATGAPGRPPAGGADIPSHVRTAAALRLGGIPVSPSDLEPPPNPDAGQTDDERRMLRYFGKSSLREVTPDMQAEWMEFFGRVGDPPQRARTAFVQGVGPDGQPGIFLGNLDTGEIEPTTGGVMPASTRKPATQSQHDNLKFWRRMDQAIAAMERVEDKVSDRELFVIYNTPDLLRSMQGLALSKEGRIYANALAMYTEARLRDESGAAIPTSEYAQDRAVVGRQIGDDPDTIAQRRANRRLVADALAASAGPAYEEVFGEPFRRRGSAGAGGGAARGSDRGSSGADEPRYVYDPASGRPVLRGSSSAGGTRRRGVPGRGLSR